MGLIPFPGQVPWSDINPWQGRPSQAFLQYLSSLDGVVRPIGSLGGLPRIVLGAAITFYVDGAAGNDSNNGLTAATAWKTFAHAMAVISGRIDFGNQTVTLQIADGTYTEQINILPWTGGGALVIQGNTTTPTNVIVSCSGLGVNDASVVAKSGTLPGVCTIKAFQIKAAGSFAHGLALYSPGVMLLDSVDFNTATGAQFIAQSGLITNTLVGGTSKTFTISGGAAANAAAGGGARVSIFGAINIAISNTPAFSTGFAWAIDSGNVTYGYGVTFSGTGATGPKFNCQRGTVDTGTGNPNYLPGTANSGIGANSGATLYN
jgi:hypothetical protein